MANVFRGELPHPLWEARPGELPPSPPVLRLWVYFRIKQKMHNKISFERVEESTKKLCLSFHLFLLLCCDCAHQFNAIQFVVNALVHSIFKRKRRILECYTSTHIFSNSESPEHFSPEISWGWGGKINPAFFALNIIIYFNFYNNHI